MLRIKKIMLIFGAVLGGLAVVFLLFLGYIRFIEHRSLSAFIAEKYLFSTTDKNPAKNSEEAYWALMQTRAENNRKRVDSPSGLLSKEVADNDIAGMQVFSWNDEHDPAQRVILYIHGGGYVHQASPTLYTMVDAVAEAVGARVVFPMYKLAPEYTFVDMYPEITELYNIVLASVNSADQITLMGDSAGGGAALGLAHALAQQGITQPKDIILLSPWLDIATDNPDLLPYEKKDPLLSIWPLQMNAMTWAGSAENLKNPLVSPMYSDRFSEMGRITLFTGTRELLYPDIILLDQMLTEQGVAHNMIVGRGMNHVYPCYAIPEAKTAQAQIAEIILE